MCFAVVPNPCCLADVQFCIPFWSENSRSLNLPVVGILHLVESCQERTEKDSRFFFLFLFSLSKVAIRILILDEDIGSCSDVFEIFSLHFRTPH